MALALSLDFTTGTLDPRITFSRASLGTYYGSDGLLKYAGHNEVLQSQTFDDASWTKAASATVTANATTAPDSTTTADRLNHVTAGTVTGGAVQQTISPPQFILSIYAKAGSKSWLAMGNSISGTRYCYFNLATGVVGTLTTAGWLSSGIQDVGNGWYRCWALTIASSAAATVVFRVAEADNTITCTSPGDIYLWGAQLEHPTTATTPSTYIPTTAAAVHGPRFDYDPVSHAPKGLLIEEARTNLAWTSQDFTSGNWTKVGSTVGAGLIAGPDGTTTPNLMTASSGTGGALNQGTSIASGNLAASVYAKKGTSDWLYLSIYPSTLADEPKAWFNLATGALGTKDALLTTSIIENVGNGWYRCSVIRPELGGLNERILIGLSDADNSKTVTVGRTIYIWGAQGESGAFVTSYIPTVGSSVARAADVATMTGTNFSSWYNQSAGTFVADFELRVATGTRPIISADNATANERILLYGSGTDPKVEVRDGGVVQADLDLGTL